MRFRILHPGAGTPKRSEVETALTAKLKIPPDKLFLVDLKTLSGKSETIGNAYIYPEKINLTTIEPRLRRKILAEGEKREGEAEGKA